MSIPCQIRSGHGAQVTGTSCHEECEARHLDPIELTRFDAGSGFQYPELLGLNDSGAPLGREEVAPNPGATRVAEVTIRLVAA